MRAPKFRNFCNLFVGFSQKNCVILTPRACFFGSARTTDPVESYNDVMRFVKLILAEKNEFCAHGATKFRKFCNSFAKFLAIFCGNFASSRRQTRNFSRLNKFMNPMRALATLRDLCSESWPSARNSLCARRAEIPEILQFIRGIFPEHLRDLDAARLLFQICTYGGPVRELE